MKYIIITIATISITTFIVYQIAKSFFKVKLRLKPLVLCAICAMLISVILPRVIVGFAGLAGTFGILLILSIVFAYFVARYHDPAEKDDSTFSDQQELNALSVQNQEFEKTDVDVDVDVPVLISSEIQVEVPVDNVPFKSTECIQDQQEEDISFTDGDEMSDDLDSTGDFVASDVIDGNDHLSILPNVNNQYIHEAQHDLNLAEFAEDVESLEVQEEPLFEDTSSTMQLVDSEDIIDEEPSDVPVVGPLSTSLDDLLEFSFSQKENQNYQQAYNGFYQALKLYSDTTIAPMLVIEMATILKNRGAYDEAIQLLATGRSLKALEENKVLDQQFIDTIAYLRIVKNYLIQHRLGSTEFSTLSRDMVMEIDQEFQEWRSLG